MRVWVDCGGMVRTRVASFLGMEDGTTSCTSHVSHLAQRSFLIPSNSSMRLQIHGNVWIHLVIPKVIFFHQRIIQAWIISSTTRHGKKEF